MGRVAVVGLGVPLAGFLVGVGVDLRTVQLVL